MVGFPTGVNPYLQMFMKLLDMHDALRSEVRRAEK